MTENKTEMETLFPEKEIYGYSLKPWTLGKIARLSPHLGALKENVKEKNIDFDKIFSSVKSKKGQKAEDNQNAMLEGLFDLAISVFPYIVPIISITTGMNLQEAEDLSIDKAVNFMVLIVEQNLSFLKNCFGSVMEIIEESKTGLSQGQ